MFVFGFLQCVERCFGVVVVLPGELLLIGSGLDCGGLSGDFGEQALGFFRLLEQTFGLLGKRVSAVDSDFAVGIDSQLERIRQLLSCLMERAAKKVFELFQRTAELVLEFACVAAQQTAGG